MAKKKKQNKPHGHYCYVCGEHKANEKFSGRGHASHICKKCHALPAKKRNEMIAERKANRFSFRSYNRQPDIKTPVLFSELDDKQRSKIIARLSELIGDYFEFAEYLPDDGDKAEILSALCAEMSDMLVDDNEGIDLDEDDEEPETTPQRTLIADDAIKAAYDEIVAGFVAELKEDGFELLTFADSLLVAETERLIIRRFFPHDLDALWMMMKRPEVMYAWEHGFSKKEVRHWLNRQYARYREDGYGYFAVTLKKSGKLIGQAGLMKSDIDGESVVEMGYIFKDNAWGKGYATEAARACVDLAFGQLGLDRLYATIRPENAPSVRVAEKLGMRRIGEYAKVYNDKEMVHDIFVLENTVNGG